MNLNEWKTKENTTDADILSLEYLSKLSELKLAEKPPIPLVECACGCGTLIPQFDKYGKERHYVKNHYRSRKLTPEERLLRSEKIMRTKEKKKKTEWYWVIKELLRLQGKTYMKKVMGAKQWDDFVKECRKREKTSDFKEITGPRTMRRLSPSQIKREMPE